MTSFSSCLKRTGIVKQKDVIGTLSNAYERTFCKNSEGLLVVSYFRKTFHHVCSVGLQLYLYKQITW